VILGEFPLLLANERRTWSEGVEVWTNEGIPSRVDRYCQTLPLEMIAKGIA
jgi:hypothetical protein